MSEKHKHINQDDFSQKIKEKLENYSMSVDENLWLGIEKKLVSPKRKKIVPFWYWLSGGVAAAVLALLLLVNPFETTDNKDLINTKITVTAQRDTISSRQTLAENDLVESFIGEEQHKIRHSTVSVQKLLRSSLAFVEKEVYQTSKTIKTEISETSKSITDSVSRSVIENNQEGSLVKKEAITTTQESNKKIDVLPDLNDYSEVIPPTKTRKKQPLLLAMAMETSGTLSGEDFQEAPLYSDASQSDRTLVGGELASKYSSVLNVSDFTETRHLPPLSVGLTVVMPFSECFSIESGLVYTYLRSEFTKPGITSYKASLNLHYLGIPLNLRAKLWNNPTWSIYLSAGGIVEKGLRSIYNQEIEDNRGTLDTDIKSKIDGLQWSLSLGLGVDVKIQKRLSLFAEPKLIYYLQNNQPESTRTESPLYVGVNGGLRIEL
ncbi:MAG TPA: PorT family protein [Bacteroidales bacterium]|nr:PorT family protein [Bacteroidales bacterium]